MYCPVCEDVRMKEVERDGVLIDICPNCKGVWLDRGEIDKITRRVNEVRRPFNDWYERNDDDREDRSDRPDGRGRDWYDDDRRSKYGSRRKKKRSVMDMLGDMFD